MIVFFSLKLFFDTILGKFALDEYQGSKHMKLKSVKIKNFRSFQEEVKIDLDDLTAFVGKNDIGKSTVLEALDIFFNEGKGIIKLEKEDVNVRAREQDDTQTVISACFEELPDKIVIDATNETTLQDEYLLNSLGHLEIVKKYTNGGAAKVFVRANHPCGQNCQNLLLKTNTDLKNIITKHSVECGNIKINAVMRKAIWEHFCANEQLEEIEIDVTKEAAKQIWDQLKKYLPMYSLFQSDRKNSDGDSEAQDPLKEAVKQIVGDVELQNKFDEIATAIECELENVAQRTLEKLKEMNPKLADSLKPTIPARENLKWAAVFKDVSIKGEDGIPINKRGSGVKRLILLNFFRAEAERRKNAEQIPSSIYAIEEPETSQHNEHQKKLIQAFLELSQTENTQIILTTHSATLVKELDFNHIRLVNTKNETKIIEKVSPNLLTYPSLNEVNYLAFTEITEEYHNELYGYIDSKNKLADFRHGKQTIQYFRDDSENAKNIPLTEKIRHQIHHPENQKNQRFTVGELKDSIEFMRNFIETDLSNP